MCPVFSNEAGEPLKTFKKAWVVAVLKAHGVDPRWRKGAYKDLSAECQQRFRDINLHWHDLRHEYASRLVERGVPLAQVRDLLGHASILTTERYDNQRLEALQAAVERLEGGKTFDPKIDAADRSFKNLSRSHRTELRSNAKTPPRNPLQVTDSLQVGELVPVRGFEPRSRG